MSVRRIFMSACLLAGAALTGGAWAQALPRPAEFYFDADAAATQRLTASTRTGDAAVQDLLSKIARNPRDIAATAHLAHLAMAGGREPLGRELYARALAAVQPSDRHYRPVVWAFAWDLYRAGHHQEALDQWRTLVVSRAISAQWMPQTLALALWTTGDRAQAVQWYAAAVRTEPQDWSTTQRYAALLPDWTDAERATLAQVHAAWAANPPPYG